MEQQPGRTDPPDEFSPGGMETVLLEHMFFCGGLWGENFHGCSDAEPGDPVFYQSCTGNQWRV